MSDSAVSEIHVEVGVRLDKLESDLKRVSTKTQKSATEMARDLRKVARAADKVPRSFKKIRMATDKMAARFKKARAVMASMRGGIIGMAAAMAVYTLAIASKQNLQFLDTLKNTAKRLGITTDFLQEAEFSATQSGIAVTTLGMAMQRFARRAAEAGKGTGEAKDAIKELNIELRTTGGRMRSTEALFTDAMDALARIEDPATRLRLAFKLFDSEGASLVQMADNFRELSKQAARSGAVVDSGVILKAAEAKGKIDALALSIRGNLSEALLGLSPIIQSSMEGMLSFAEGVAAAWEVIVDKFDLAPVTLEQVNRKILEVQKEVGRQRKLNAEFPDLPIDAEARLASLRKQKAAIIDLNRVITEREIARAAGTFIEPGEAAALAETMKVVAKGAAEETARREKASSDRIGDEEAFRDLKESLTQEEIASRRAAEDERLRSEVVARDKREKMRIEEFKKEKMRIESLELTWENGIKNIDGLYDDLASSFNSQLADMLAMGEVSFRALGEAFSREFTQRVLKELALDPFFGAIGDLIKGVAGSFGGLGDSGPGSPSTKRLNEFIDTGSAPGRLSFSAPTVNVFNNSPSSVRSSTGIDGSVDVFVGGQAATDLLNGGSLALALESRYPILSPQGIRR